VNWQHIPNIIRRAYNMLNSGIIVSCNRWRYVTRTKQSSTDVVYIWCLHTHVHCLSFSSYRKAENYIVCFKQSCN